MLSVFETKVVEGPKLSGQVMDIIIYCNSWFRLIFYNQRRFFVSEKWRIIKKRSSRNFGYSSSLAPETFFTCQTQLLRFLYLTSYSEYIFFSMNIINNVFLILFLCWIKKIEQTSQVLLPFWSVLKKCVTSRKRRIHSRSHQWWWISQLKYLIIIKEMLGLTRF